MSTFVSTPQIPGKQRLQVPSAYCGPAPRATAPAARRSLTRARARAFRIFEFVNLGTS
jgi:hypothetical protein